MNSCVPIISRICDKWFERYIQHSKSSLDVMDAFTMYTAEIAFNVFFGEDSFYSIPNAQKAIRAVLKSMDDMHILAESPQNLFIGHWFIKLGLRGVEREYKRNNQFFSEFLKKELQAKKKQIIEAKSTQTETKAWRNLIELFIEEAPKSGLSENEIESEMLYQMYSFFVAAIDTSSNTLTLSQYLLAKHPEIQQKLRDEINATLLAGEEVTKEHLANMKYLHAVFRKTLRYGGPAGSFFPRRAQEGVMIGDLEIKKDYFDIVALIVLAYNPKHFSNPYEFRPERWIERVEEGTKDPYANIPFWIGARRCLGEQLRTIQTKIMICELIRKFRIDIDPSYKLALGVGLMYQPRGSMDIIYEEI